MEQEFFQMINTRAYALGGAGGTIAETTNKQLFQSKGSNLAGWNLLLLKLPHPSTPLPHQKN